MKLTIVSNVLFCLQNEKPVYYRIKSFDPVNNYKWSELVVDDYRLIIDCNIYEYHIDVPIIFWTDDCAKRFQSFSSGNSDDFKLMMDDPKGDVDLLFDKEDVDSFSGFLKWVNGERYWIKKSYNDTWIGVWEYENVQD